MDIMSPSELVLTNLERSKVNVAHITTVINKALGGLQLLPGDNQVTDLYLCGARTSDIDLVERLLSNAGYRSVKATSRAAEHQTVDILVSFFIPQ